MRQTKQLMRWCHAIASASTMLLAFVAVACASLSTKDGGYGEFLQKIATECKPLIVGADDFGQAIVFNGVGASVENYNNFLDKTSALYSGGISAKNYRASLTSFIGTGSYNERSFDCVIAHLPSAKSEPSDASGK